VAVWHGVRNDGRMVSGSDGDSDAVKEECRGPFAGSPNEIPSRAFQIKL
jgi:hypothetical protein